VYLFSRARKVTADLEISESQLAHRYDPFGQKAHRLQPWDEGPPPIGEIQFQHKTKPDGKATTCLDVSAYVLQKMAAMAAHRTRFSVETDTFPSEMLRDLFGKEYFTRVHPLPDLETNLFTMSDVLHGRWSTKRTKSPSKG
jgi:LmbE family N-acetylglucosaminyl deacetylase